MKVLQIENEKIFQNTNSKNFANLVGTNCDFDFSLGDMIILQNENKDKEEEFIEKFIEKVEQNKKK